RARARRHARGPRVPVAGGPGLLWRACSLRSRSPAVKGASDVPRGLPRAAPAAIFVWLRNDRGRAGTHRGRFPGSAARGAPERGGPVGASQSRTKGGERVAQVILEDGDSLDRALRRFKRQVQRAGIFSDLRRKKYYEKPSEERKRKSNA